MTGQKYFLGPALARSAGNIFPKTTNQAKNMHFEDVCVCVCWGGGGERAGKTHGLHEICAGFFMTLRSLTMY